MFDYVQSRAGDIQQHFHGGELASWLTTAQRDNNLKTDRHSTEHL